MRNGDFSEVLALNPSFRIYDPATGTSTGANRSFFDNAIIPADRISSIARQIQALYPSRTTPARTTGSRTICIFLATPRRTATTTT